MAEEAPSAVELKIREAEREAERRASQPAVSPSGKERPAKPQEARAPFVALWIVAILVAVATGSIPAGIAMVAGGGGGFILSLFLRASRS